MQARRSHRHSRACGLLWILISWLGVTACKFVRSEPQEVSGLRVVGGEVSKPRQYPFMVSIFNDKEQRVACGGALIAPKLVLTAAHCFADSWFPTSKFVVRLGKHHVLMNEDQEERIKIQKIVQHDDFSSTTLGLENDIALVLLKDASKFTPIKLNRDPQLPAKGSLQRLIGWGTLSELSQRPADILREIDLPIVDNRTCAYLNNGIEIRDYQLCAGFVDGKTEKGPCRGDSGGPLFDPQGEMTLWGLVSGGLGCARPNAPGFYTRISAFVGWVEKKADDLGSPLPR